MRSGVLDRLAIIKFFFGLVALLILPALVFLLLDGSPFLAVFTTMPERPNVFSQDLLLPASGFQQQRGQECLGDDVSGLDEPTDQTLRSTDRWNNDCNYAKGKWVADEKWPLYSGKECKEWLSMLWACRLMERSDFSYESYRWQPYGCEMPEFSGPNFLQRMRHKTLAFVSDSLGRQQFQSMMCIATGGKHSPEVEDVGWKYGLVKAPAALSPGGSAHRFPKTNTTILFYWSPTLSELEPLNATGSETSYALHLDRPPSFLKKHFHSFDALVLNTGHHWNTVKFTRNRWRLYADGKPVGDSRLSRLNFTRARSLKLQNMARWVDSELVRSPRIRFFLRTMSPSHFVNGEWNTGGRCDDTAPLSDGSEVLEEYSGDLGAELAVNGTRVRLLDVTSMSKLRGEGHISNHSIKVQRAVYDCLHWCLPGVPDAWNELFFAQMY